MHVRRWPVREVQRVRERITAEGHPRRRLELQSLVREPRTPTVRPQLLEPPRRGVPAQEEREVGVSVVPHLLDYLPACVRRVNEHAAFARGNLRADTPPVGPRNAFVQQPVVTPLQPAASRSQYFAAAIAAGIQVEPAEHRGQPLRCARAVAAVVTATSSDGVDGHHSHAPQFGQSAQNRFLVSRPHRMQRKPGLAGACELAPSHPFALQLTKVPMIGVPSWPQGASHFGVMAVTASSPSASSTPETPADQCPGAQAIQRRRATVR